MYAAGLNKNEAIISVLVQSGAELNAKDSAGKTAFDYSKGNPNIKGTKVYWELNDARYK